MPYLHKKWYRIFRYWIPQSSEIPKLTYQAQIGDIQIQEIKRSKGVQSWEIIVEGRIFLKFTNLALDGDFTVVGKRALLSHRYETLYERQW